MQWLHWQLTQLTDVTQQPIPGSWKPYCRLTPNSGARFFVEEGICNLALATHRGNPPRCALAQAGVRLKTQTKKT